MLAELSAYPSRSTDPPAPRSRVSPRPAPPPPPRPTAPPAPRSRAPPRRVPHPQIHVFARGSRRTRTEISPFTNNAGQGITEHAERLAFESATVLMVHAG